MDSSPTRPPAGPVKSSAVSLAGAANLAEASQRILRSCLQQMLDNRAGVVRGTRPEYVHQMRVGLRRFKVAMWLFAPWASFPDALRSELRWLGRELGNARDLDVLANETLVHLCDACPLEAGLVTLQKYAVALAMKRHRRAGVAVGSKRCFRLFVALDRWVESVGVEKPMKASLSKASAQILRRVHATLLVRARSLSHGSAEDRHAVRIAAKRARYAADFFSCLYDPHDPGRYLRLLARMQGALGWLNDIATAQALLQGIARKHRPLAMACSFARGYLQGIAEDKLGTLGKWQRRLDREPSPRDWR